MLCFIINKMLKQYSSATTTGVVCCMSALGSLNQGILITFMNSALDQYTALLEIKEAIPFYQGLLQSSLAIGAAIGALAVSTVIARASRRLLFILLDLICIVGSVAMLSHQYIIGGRFAQGISVGMNLALTGVFQRETIPVQLYGYLAHCPVLLGSLGSLFACLVPGASPSTLLYLVIGVSFTRILYLLIVYPYETVPYLILKGYTQEGIDLQSQLARQLIGFHYAKQFRVKIEQDTSQYAETHGQSSFQQILEPKHRLRIFLAVGLSVIQQFSGINAIIFYSVMIFEALFDRNTAMNLTILISVLRLVVYFASIYVGQVAGRLAMLKMGLWLCAITNLIIGALLMYFNEDELSARSRHVLLVAIFLFLIGFWVSLGGTLQIYIPEIVPEAGVALCTSVQWLLAGVVTQLFPMIRDAFGLGSSFVMFGSSCLLGLVVVSTLAAETRGLTAYQVDQAFLRLHKQSDKIW